jgi:hypothetical protein
VNKEIVLTRESGTIVNMPAAQNEDKQDNSHMEVEVESLINQKLPLPVLLQCLSYCDLAEIIGFPLVCKVWGSIVDNDLFWKYYFINHFGEEEASKLQPLSWKDETKKRYNFEDFPHKQPLLEMERAVEEFGSDLLKELSQIFYQSNNVIVKAIEKNVDGKECKNGKCKLRLRLFYSPFHYIACEFSKNFELLSDACANVYYMGSVAAEAMLYFDDPKNCKDYATAVHYANQLKGLTEEMNIARDKYFRILDFLKQ